METWCLSFSGIDTKENMILGPKIMMTIFGIMCVTNSMDIPNPSFWITYLLIIILNIDYKVQKPPDAETSPSPDFLKTSTTTTYTKSLYNTFYIKKKLWTQLAENIQISHQ
ncbi:unnamed protein product [Gordionus sp. m RMFG-2023]